MTTKKLKQKLLRRRNCFDYVGNDVSPHTLPAKLERYSHIAICPPGWLENVQKKKCCHAQTYATSARIFFKNLKKGSINVLKKSVCYFNTKYLLHSIINALMAVINRISQACALRVLSLSRAKP